MPSIWYFRLFMVTMKYGMSGTWEQCWTFRRWLWCEEAFVGDQQQLPGWWTPKSFLKNEEKTEHCGDLVGWSGCRAGKHVKTNRPWSESCDLGLLCWMQLRPLQFGRIGRRTSCGKSLTKTGPVESETVTRIRLLPDQTLCWIRGQREKYPEIFFHGCGVLKAR